MRGKPARGHQDAAAAKDRKLGIEFLTEIANLYAAAEPALSRHALTHLPRVPRGFCGTCGDAILPAPGGKAQTAAGGRTFIAEQEEEPPVVVARCKLCGARVKKKTAPSTSASQLKNAAAKHIAGAGAERALQSSGPVEAARGGRDWPSGKGGAIVASTSSSISTAQAAPTTVGQNSLSQQKNIRNNSTTNNETATGREVQGSKGKGPKPAAQPLSARSNARPMPASLQSQSTMGATVSGLRELLSSNKSTANAAPLLAKATAGAASSSTSSRKRQRQATFDQKSSNKKSSGSGASSRFGGFGSL